MARLGKRERATAKAVRDVVKGNLENMSALHKEHRAQAWVVTKGGNRVFGSVSCADPVRLKIATTHGYRDNLHGKYQPKPSRAMAVPDRENIWKAPRR